MSDDDKPHLSLVPKPEHKSGIPCIGDPADGPTDLEAKADAAALEMEVLALASQLPMAVAFAPHFPDEEIPRLAMFMVKEQHEINRLILPDMADVEAEHKMLNVVIVRAAVVAPGGPKPPQAVFPAFKRIDEQDNPQLVIPPVMVLAFLLSPVARAVLRMNGWSYSFAKSHAPKESPLVSL